VAVLPNPFNETFQGVVTAAGTLTIRFGPTYSNKWEVTQVSLEMPLAPSGSAANVRYMGSLVAASPSARRGTASGDPPIFLQPGETMTVEWTGCTPATVGKVLVSYRKHDFL
jgi:hypothetical protein